MKLELKKVETLSALSILWEEKMAYQYIIDASPDGKHWYTVVDKSKNSVIGSQKVQVKKDNYLRIRTTGLPSGRWASIKEISLFDGDGKPILNDFVHGKNFPSASDFNDSKWRTLNVPHDWGIEGPFRQELPGWTGKLPWVGIGWYRKEFAIPFTDQGKKIFIDFDGAMSDATIYLNGKKVGAWRLHDGSGLCDWKNS